MSEKYFHFTLGPVQGFVSQARRTRDFWAGSFLLSWLTAKAIKAVQDAGGEMVMPSVTDDRLLKRLAKTSGEGPNIGSLPNNFIAEVPDGFDGNIAVEAVQKAWKALADSVWGNDKLEAAGVSPELWESQITSFWDMAWVISANDDAAVLAQRKNLRSYMPPETIGDKCTMMGEWQELSGIDSPADKSERQKQKKFWQALSTSKGLDLRENERLCAIAYVKRRFVHAWKSLGGHKGWKLPASVPSVSYMAAVPWLKQVMDANDEGLMASFHDAAKALDEDYGEWSTDILEDACASSRLKQNFSSLDGRLFFESEMEKDKYRPLKSKLKALKEKFDLPSPFYAILMMDGDSLGETKEKLAKAGLPATALSDALASFTKEVPDIVEKHDGFLIYAGGDDVLAILPLEDAMGCALACRKAYQDAFGKQKATISAAIEYAHMKLPLTMILKDAHTLLDDVAKDATGRDAIACRVWKPGGVQQIWAMPWDIPNKKKGDGCIAHATDIILLVEEMAKRAEKKSDVGYASKLLYTFREMLNNILPDSMPEKGDEIKELADNIRELHLGKVLETAYLSSGLLDGWKENEEGQSKLAYVQQQIGKLMPLMRVHDKNGDWNGLYSAEGALLLRFLAQKGVER